MIYFPLSIRWALILQNFVTENLNRCKKFLK